MSVLMTLIDDANRNSRRLDEIKGEIAAKAKERADLALLASENNIEARARRAAIKLEIADLEDAFEECTAAGEALQKIIAETTAEDHAREDAHLRRKMIKALRKREVILKDLDRGIALLVENVTALRDTNDNLFAAWRPKWPFVGPILAYPGTVDGLVGHALFVAFSANKLSKLPEAKYYDKAWPGSLHRKFCDATKWAKGALLDGVADDEPAEPTEAIRPALSEPVEAAAPEDVRYAMSPRDWVKNEERVEAAKPRRADGTDFDLF